MHFCLNCTSVSHNRRRIESFPARRHILLESGDPLSRLVVNQAEVDRELLAQVLADKVTIDPDAGTFAFKHRVRKQLGKSNTVLTALLAQKALVLLGAELAEPLQPRDLEASTGIRGGTLRPILKKLNDEAIISRKSNGYLVPNHCLEAVTDLLSEQGDQNGK